jgi:hypothetical protein
MVRMLGNATKVSGQRRLRLLYSVSTQISAIGTETAYYRWESMFVVPTVCAYLLLPLTPLTPLALYF